MLLRFTKMHGLGNDFVVIDAVHQAFVPTAERIRRLADRRLGVGCDQVLLVEAADAAGVDFRYRIFNADGNEVEQCGNGARCFVRFVREKGLTDKDDIIVQTLAGMMRLKAEGGGEVTVNMGVPELEPARIPFEAERRELVYTLDVNGERVEITAVSMGNPHAVQVVDDIARAPVLRQGPLIERHPRFPRRVNAGYMQVIDRQRVRVRVFERGAGETLACGSGACAAVVAGRLRGLLDEHVEAALPGGGLTISWAGEGQSVWMTGPAATVFEGTIELSTL